VIYYHDLEDNAERTAFMNGCILLGFACAACDRRAGVFRGKDESLSLFILRRSREYEHLVPLLVPSANDSAKLLQQTYESYGKGFAHGYVEGMRKDENTSSEIVVPGYDNHAFAFYDPASETFGYRICHHYPSYSHMGEARVGFPILYAAEKDAIETIRKEVPDAREWIEIRAKHSGLAT
jgi:hypothetical protein